MKAFRLISLMIALALLTTLAVAAGAPEPATLNNGGCSTSTGIYDPACDVDHDGDIDVHDIQLTAGHWSETGTFTSDNDHNHLGQTWVGIDNPLVISGAFSYPDYAAPLWLSNSVGTGLEVDWVAGDGVYVNHADNNGLHVNSVGGNGVQVDSAHQSGVQVDSANNHGVWVGTVGDAGLYVDSAGGDGVYVGSATEIGVVVESAGNHGVRVGSTVGGNGVHVDSAHVDGVHVESAGNHGVWVGTTVGGNGVHVDSAHVDGVHVESAGDHGVRVSSTVGGNGVQVDSAQQSGVQVDSANNHGVRVGTVGDAGLYVDSAGGDGVYVHEADSNGVYAHTTDADGEWGLITPDKISGSNVTLSSLTIIAQVTGDQALTAGQVVAAVGVTEPLPDSSVPLALVRPADSGSFGGIVGVVEGRMALTPKPRHEDEKDQDLVLELRSAEGPAQPGDYVALTVLGVAQVKVEAGADIQPGRRLTASDVAGNARALKKVWVEGVRLAEDAPSIGIALAAPEPGQDTIPVFVTLR
ncbi:MAG: hypothetical protein U9R25_01715 [Chloroflexota bacterium]|nr:hypothetical protein [Chloroflexota bacterium]